MLQIEDNLNFDPSNESEVANTATLDMQDIALPGYVADNGQAMPGTPVSNPQVNKFLKTAGIIIGTGIAVGFLSGYFKNSKAPKLAGVMPKTVKVQEIDL